MNNATHPNAPPEHQASPEVAKVPGKLNPLQPTTPAPQTTAQAIATMHAAAIATESASQRILELVERRDENPEQREAVINDANNGQYQVPIKFRRLAKSLGIINPNNVAILVGFAGASASTQARALSIPAFSAVTLPVWGLEFMVGADPAVLAANSALVFVFRYETVQPLLWQV